MIELADDSENVAFIDDEVLFAVDFDVCAAVFADEDNVVHFDRELDDRAFVILAGAESHHFSFLGLLFSGVRDNDATGSDFFSFDALQRKA